jgi:hypothetical protein
MNRRRHRVGQGSAIPTCHWLRDPNSVSRMRAKPVSGWRCIEADVVLAKHVINHHRGA